MSLCRIVYLSERKPELTDDVLSAITEHSRSKNEMLGISGLLLASDKYLLQVLEGERLRLVSLYHRIAEDERHCNVIRLIEKEVTERQFPDWGMKQGHPSQRRKIDLKRMNKIVLHARISASEDTAMQVMSLLSDFRDQLMTSAA